MNKTLFLFFILTYSSISFAGDFCARTQSDMKMLLSEKTSRISFKNNGGLFNGGVCWWHSRLQRSSAYLVQFRPDRNRPTNPELNMILNSLRMMNKTVVIPGYQDFETFSTDYKNEIQAMLNDWQKRDGFFNFEWMRGISGKSSLEPDQMRARMDDVYKHYKNSPTPLWIMAQIKGIESHSFLILRMVQTENGYTMEVIDSNHPVETVTIDYHQGDRNLRATGAKYSFVPYVGFQNDFVKLSQALKSACGGLTEGLDLSDVQEGDVELPHAQY
jgi:hypothetical protein